MTHSLGGSDTFVDVSFSNDGLYFATLDVFGELASYRVSDGVNAALLTPDDVTTTLTGGPLGGMVPVGDHSFIAANGSANRAVLERGDRAGRRALCARTGWEPERGHRQRERLRRVRRGRHDDMGVVRPRVVRRSRDSGGRDPRGLALRDQRGSRPVAGGRR